MTYNHQRNKIHGTTLHFQRDTSNLPVDKLQSFWQFRSPVSDGQATFDLVGNNNFISAGNVGWSPTNPIGGAIGSSKFINAGFRSSGFDPTHFCPTNRGVGFWISLWFKPDASAHPSTTGIIIGRAKNNGNRAWALTCGGNVALTSHPDGGNASWNTATTTDLVGGNYGNWNHVVFGHDNNYSNGSQFLSLNGEAIKIESGYTWQIANSSTGLTVGFWDNGTNFFVGEIADVALFVGTTNFPTAENIADLYNGGSGNTLIRG